MILGALSEQECAGTGHLGWNYLLRMVICCDGRIVLFLWFLFSSQLKAQTVVVLDGFRLFIIILLGREVDH